MSADRRYDDDEVSEIFARATAMDTSPATSPAKAPSASSGLTLAQLQEIGADIGIPPERIAEAALDVSTRPTSLAQRTFLGAPRSVSRIVPISRALTDDEWSRLVVDLRETFGAEGRIREHGALRTWRNGNLQVHVEPSGDHYRVRMQTLKGDVYTRLFVAGMALVVSTVALLDAGSSPVRNVMLAGLIGAAGIGLVGYTRALLPRWAALRAAQMEGLAQRIRKLLGEH